MESLQEFLNKEMNESFNVEDVREEVTEIRRKLQDLATIVEDNPPFYANTDRAQKVIYKMLGELEFLQHLVSPAMAESEISEGTWALPKSQAERYEKGSYYIKRIEDLKDEIYPIFGDDLLFDHFDGAIKEIERLMGIPAEEIKEGLNEEAGIAIPQALQNNWLSVKKQIMDKEKKMGMITNEINILKRNLLAIENKASQMQQKEPEQQNPDAQGDKTQTIEVEGKIKESVDLDYWWKTNVTESIEEEEPDIDLAADDVEDAVEAEDIVDAEEGEEAIKDDDDSLKGDYVFTLKVIDKDEEEDIIVKFYQDEDDDYWKGRVVQGEEEPIESMQFDPDMEMIDIIEHLATMFDEIEQIDTDDYEDMLDDKEEIDSTYYGDIIEK